MDGSTVVRFFVPGIPRPGGSKRGFVPHGRDGRPILRNGRPMVVVREDGEHTADWRASVRQFARCSYGGALLDEPLELRITFLFARPRGHFGSGRHADRVRPTAPAFPTRPPDVTKLIRSTEDALTGVIWHDDSRVVRQWAQKLWGEKPGAWIEIRTVPGGSPVPAPATGDLFATAGG